MYKGVFTAIITPFKEDQSIDWDALKNLVDYQLKNKVTGIVPCGTTGETPTLTEEEKETVIKKIVEWVDGRCQIIAGSGTNSTEKTIRASKKAEELGVDALLVVNPYYNKPTQEGLYRHFKAVADAVSIPVVVYNIKGRTGVNVETDTLLRLIKDCDNIKAVKEASGDMEQIKEVIEKTPEDFSVLSGDDKLTLDLIKAGGQGVVSVASNMIPDRMIGMVENALEGNFKEAEISDKELQIFFKEEMMETNPIPIKAALSMKGMCNEIYRLPMCEMRPKNREKWQDTLHTMKLI